MARHYGIRTRRYKLVFIYDYGDWELYDLERDPHEIHNVYEDPKYAEIRERLKHDLRELRLKYQDHEGIDF